MIAVFPVAALLKLTTASTYLVAAAPTYGGVAGDSAVSTLTASSFLRAMVVAPCLRRRGNHQAELEALAAAKVSRAMRLAVIAAVRAGSAVAAVVSAPLYSTISASVSAFDSVAPVSAASSRKN